MKQKIIIINGPNLNLLGEREKEKYGNITLKQVEKECKNFGKKNNTLIVFKQSNIEGKIINQNKYKIVYLKNKDKMELVHFIGGG